MKILFFTYDFPYPTTSGGKTRAYNLLKYAKNGNSITLFSFTREGFEEKNKEYIKTLGISNIYTFPRKKVVSLRNIINVIHPKNSIFRSLYYDKEVERKLLEIVASEKIDVVHFESFYTSFYISQKLRSIGVKQIFGTENIEHILYRDFAKYKSTLFLKPFYLRESKKIEQEEKRLFKDADICLAVTKHEAEFIHKVTNKRCHVVENGVELSSFVYNPKKLEDKKQVLFIGDFSYFPNREAVFFFYKEVFKKIMDTSIIFKIVGKGSSNLPFANAKNIYVDEYVKDIRDAYYASDVFVSPIRIGGGTNFKILESMATGVPVVAFPNRLDGLHVKANKHILVADTANEFVSQTKKLLEDEMLRKTITTNARELVEKEFSWEVIGKKLDSIWKE